MTEVALKACPFCGSTNLEHGKTDASGLFWWAVTCLGCGASVEASVEGVEVDRWNTRKAAWEDIESAPKDGTHFLAATIGTSFGYFNGEPAPEVQTVVHWWGNPGEEGFYTSVNELEPQRPFPATHWKPLERVTAPHP